MLLKNDVQHQTELIDGQYELRKVTKLYSRWQASTANESRNHTSDLHSGLTQVALITEACGLGRRHWFFSGGKNYRQCGHLTPKYHKKRKDSGFGSLHSQIWWIHPRRISKVVGTSTPSPPPVATPLHAVRAAWEVSQRSHMNQLRNILSACHDIFFLHVWTCEPLFPISGRLVRLIIQSCVWLGDPFIKPFLRWMVRDNACPCA